MIANQVNAFGVWSIEGIVIAREHGRWTAHLFSFDEYFDGATAKAKCNRRIAHKELVTSPTFVLRTCGGCLNATQ